MEQTGFLRAVTIRFPARHGFNVLRIHQQHLEPLRKMPISAPLQSTTAGASEKSMSSSLFAAIARMSRFCSFVSFLIDSPFVRFGSASRDDTNDFFVVFLIKSMNDQ